MNTSEAPAAPATAPSTEDSAELQRGALHDLLTLARDSSARQAQAEGDLAATLKELESRRKKHTAHLVKLYAHPAQGLRLRAAAKRVEMQDAAKVQRDAAVERHDAERKSFERKVEIAREELQQQLKGEMCEFSGLWDAFRLNSGKTEDDVARRHAERQEAIASCSKRVEKRVLSVMGKVLVNDPAAAPNADRLEYAEAAAAMEAACGRLERVSGALWCDNGGGWVGVLVAAILAGATTFLVMGAQSIVLFGLRGTPLSGAAAGAAGLACGAAVYLCARSLFKKRMREMNEALPPAREAIATTAAAADGERERTLAQVATARAEAHAQHTANMTRVKNNFAPLQKKLEEDIARRNAELDARKKKGLQAVQAALDNALAACDERDVRAQAKDDQHQRLLARMDRGLAARRAKAEAKRAAQLAAIKARWSEGCGRITRMINHLTSLNASTLMDWSSGEWAKWVPPSSASGIYRFGRLRLEGQLVGATADFHLDLPSKVAVPALLKTSASLYLEHDADGRPVALDLLRTALSRLLLAVPPGAVRLTLVDPVGLGESFAGFMHLAESEVDLVGGRIWTAPEDIERKLGDLTDHMENVIQKYLRNAYQTIEEYNAQAGELAEPYRVLVAADFPASFSQVAQEKLSSIIQTGARCGVHVLMARDLRQGTIPDPLRDALCKNSAWIQCAGEQVMWQDPLYGRFPFLPDGMPDEKLLTHLLERIAADASKCQKVEVPFRTITPSDAEVWSRSAASGLRIPVGRSGVSRVQEFDLGRGTRQHALVAGKTGSGKSSLLNAIITNLALWYAPSEAQLLLIDFKKGIEFKAYARHKLPHAQAVAIESDLEFGLSVLRRLDAEMERRGNLFRVVGAQDMAAYREAAPKDEPKLPRLLLVIDEFQEFFAKDDRISQDAGALLDRIARQGRAFGIHMLLGSQTLGGGASIPRSTLGQMAVRIALQCDEADAQLILSDTNTAARLLSRPGEAIYNDSAGRVEANTPFQVAWLSDDVRDASLERVAAHAQKTGLSYPSPLVFEGGATADPADNAALTEALALANAQSPSKIKLWLGSPVAIKEATCAILGRQAGDNLLVVGPNDEAATGILASALVGAAAQARDAAFTVLDGTPEDALWVGALRASLEAVSAQAQFPAMREAEAALAEVHAETKRRLASGESGNRRFLVIHGLQRYRALRKSEAGYAFSMDAAEKPPSPDKMLADIIRDGPSVGVHTLIYADGHAAFDRCFERNMLREFDHRLLMQVSSADSSNLMDANDAAVLGSNRALLFSEERGVKEKCLPYRIPRADWLAGLKK